METSHLLGRQIGHFRIVDVLGSGGMGAVFVGFDERLQRRVALKALHPGQFGPEAKARFLREARMLSQLKHPHICQIHDIIDSPEGEFLVLELIDGKRLGDVIAANPSTQMKMRIARQLAEVLAVTHARGIIHRDLKPANVMVTTDEEVKVLDFGLARDSAVAPDAVTMSFSGGPFRDRSEPEESFTQVGEVMGTLSHMSPEQARGEPVTTAADMYSYGLILQELFTGRSAQVPGLSPEEQLARVRAGTTAPVEGLDDDTAALITRLKSLAPAARPTAVDVIDRLDDIAAAPIRRRRRTLAWAAGVVLAVVAVGMSYQAWRINGQARRIAEEAARANREAASASEVSGFLTNIFQVSNPSEARGQTVTARELLDKAAADIEGRLNDQPLVKARLMGPLAHVYQSLGLYPQAQPLAERSLELRQANLPPANADVADSTEQLGWLRFLRGDLAGAASLLQRAVDIRAQLPETLPYADTLNALAIVLQNQGNTRESEALHERALAIFDRLVPAGSARVATALSDLAYLEYTAGEYADAEAHFLRAIPMLEQHAGPDDPALAITLSQLGGTYRDQGKSALAEPLFLRSIAIQEKVLGAEHPYLALRLDGLGRIYSDEQKNMDAERVLLRAIAIDEKALGPDHPWLAQSLFNLALVYRDEHKMADAERFATRATGIYERARGSNTPDVANGLVLEAELKTAQGRKADAAPLLSRAIDIYQHQPALNAYPRSLYAEALWLSGRNAEAAAEARALRASGFGRRDFVRLCAALGVGPDSSR